MNHYPPRTLTVDTDGVRSIGAVQSMGVGGSAKAGQGKPSHGTAETAQLVVLLPQYRRVLFVLPHFVVCCMNSYLSICFILI